MNNEGLKELRDVIDAIDDELLELLQRRASVAIEVGRIKERMSLPVEDRAREQQVLGRLSNKSLARPLSKEAVNDVFSAVIRACRSVQSPVKVAFLGPLGTLSHTAALNHFGSANMYLPQNNLKDVFAEVRGGRADLGLVPFENSVDGPVGQTLDQLGAGDLKVRGLVSLQMSLALMSRNPDLGSVEKIVSHPQALDQARQWLSQNLPGVEQGAMSSTNAAAARATADDSVALLGHPLLADLHDLNTLVVGLEDQPGNRTFFLILGREYTKPTGHDRTMAWFDVPHSSGSLYACLQPLADAGLNMTRLHSRPCPDNLGEYRFFLEIEGHFNDEKVAAALEAMAQCGENFHLLGSYEARDEDLDLQIL